MRVLQAMAGAEHGGAETYFVHLVLALQRAGLDQQAVIRRHSGRAAALRAGGVPTTEFRFGGKLDFVTPLALRRAADRIAPQIAVTWMSRASAVFPRGPWVQIGRLGGYYGLKYFRRCQHLVCNTPDLVRHCVDEGWAPERVHYLPNFLTPAALPAQDRAGLQTPNDAPLLLALGRLHRNKAFDVLLQAVAALPETFLWLAGEGPERSALERLARELGIASRVRFLGWRGDREALYAAADLCIVPSREEPFGNVILDAWAAGVPLIAARAVGPSTFVRDGDNGVLVPIDDSVALAGAIARLLAEPGQRQRLVAGGRAAWQADHTEDVVVRRWLELFRQVTT